MTKKKIVILGAGLAGLSCAWHLKQKGIESVVLEKEKTSGGLCRSKQIKGFIFDCDGHLLHFRDNYTLRLVKKLLPGNLALHKRSAWIKNFNLFTPYPFQANLHTLPKAIASECLWGFIRAQGNRANNHPVNFLQWINAAFGKGMAKHFLVPYNQKFWTVPLNRMLCPWRDKFIPQPNIGEVINGFFAKNRKDFGYNATFWYPRKGGIAELALAFEQQIGKISKNCCVQKVDLDKKEITVRGKGRQKFDILVMTLPLPELIKIIKPLPDKILKSFAQLRWNSIFNLNLGIAGACHKSKHWVYFPNPDTSFFRVGFFHNFASQLVPAGQSSLYAEVSYSANKPINKKRVTSRIIKDLYNSGILNKNNRVLVADTNDIKYGYPIYDQHYFRATEAIKEFLLSRNIILCGRYGNWQYFSMEDTLLDGKKVAAEISRCLS